MNPDIVGYNNLLESPFREVCDSLAAEIDKALPEAESRIWHRHPVWFLEGNPTVGYSRQKPGVRLMFWSGADFGEAALHMRGAKFKDASVFFNEVREISLPDLRRWLGMSREIRWNYRDLVRKKGVLEKL